jgi:hypothetical protein
MVVLPLLAYPSVGGLQGGVGGDAINQDVVNGVTQSTCPSVYAV